MIKVTRILSVQLENEKSAVLSETEDVLINPDHIMLVEPFTLVERKKDKVTKHEAVRVHLTRDHGIFCHSFDEFCGMLSCANLIKFEAPIGALLDK